MTRHIVEFNTEAEAESSQHAVYMAYSQDREAQGVQVIDGKLVTRFGAITDRWDVVRESPDSTWYYNYPDDALLQSAVTTGTVKDFPSEWSPQGGGGGGGYSLDSALSDGHTITGNNAVYSGPGYGRAYGQTGYSTDGSSKYYFEARINALNGGFVRIGWAIHNLGSQLGPWVDGNDDAVVYCSCGKQYRGNSEFSPYDSLGDGDILGVTMDFSQNTYGVVAFYKNNTQVGLAVGYLSKSGPYYPVLGNRDSGGGAYDVDMLFASGDWTYTPPAGFVELS